MLSASPREVSGIQASRRSDEAMELFSRVEEDLLRPEDFCLRSAM
jgi:hypothetical protein